MLFDRFLYIHVQICKRIHNQIYDCIYFHTVLPHFLLSLKLQKPVGVKFQEMYQLMIQTF